MKKIILLILLLPSTLLANNNDFGDVNDQKKTTKTNAKVYKWELGINGGMNFSKITGNYGNSYDIINRTGTLYGVTVTYNFNRFLSLKGDFDYENKGFILQDFDYKLNANDTTFSTGDVTQILNYFDIPAFLHVGFGKKIKFDINFGPYIAFKINDETIDSNKENNNVIIIDNDLNSGFNNFDYGITYGFGIDYFLTDRVSLGFDFLVEDGLKNILKNSNQELFNKSLDFDFGINFFIGKKK